MQTSKKKKERKKKKMAFNAKTKIFSVSLGVWFWLLFKVFFMPKCIKIIFFYFLKIIFESSTSKLFKT